MAVVPVKLKSGAVPKLLKSAEMQKVLSDRAKKFAAGLPDVKVSDPFEGRNRARVLIDSQSPRGREALQRKVGR